MQLVETKQHHLQAIKGLQIVFHNALLYRYIRFEPERIQQSQTAIILPRKLYHMRMAHSVVGGVPSMIV